MVEIRFPQNNAIKAETTIEHHQNRLAIAKSSIHANGPRQKAHGNVHNPDNLDYVLREAVSAAEVARFLNCPTLHRHG